MHDMLYIAAMGLTRVTNIKRDGLVIKIIAINMQALHAAQLNATSRSQHTNLLSVLVANSPSTAAQLTIKKIWTIHQNHPWLLIGYCL